MKKRTVSMRVSVFWRCLLAFVVFWAVMMGTLVVQEQRKAAQTLELTVQSAMGLAAQSYADKQPKWDEGSFDELSGALTSYFLPLAKYGSFVYEYYDDRNGGLVGESFLSGDWVNINKKHYTVDFDAVLSDGEQAALAAALRKTEDWPADTQYVYGSNVPAGYIYGPVMVAPRSGRITGVMEGNVIYPKAVVLDGPEGDFPLVEAEALGLADKDLTEWKFLSSNLFTALRGDDPAEQAVRYRKMKEWTAEYLAKARESGLQWEDGSVGIATEGGRTLRATRNLTRQFNVIAYDFNTWDMALDSIAARGTYLWTFLVMVVLAVLLSLALSWALSGPLAKLSKAVEDEKLPYQPDTRIREVNVMARAVNEAQKKLSDDLERQRELTRAVAHELKTPAAVLRAYAEGLHEDIAPEKREEYLRILMEESDRMGALVGELLEFSRLEQGRAPLELEQVDLTELTERTFRRLELPMEQRGLTLDFDLSPVTLTADPARLGQVLDNLASNALRYADPGAVKVRLTNEGGTARLTVENACAPIEPEVLSKLFEPFYRPDKARSRELGGSGLGLAIVANVVRLHGGVCGAEAVDGGIRFTVELPVKEANEG